ncbi:Nif3-like dinuclear metal center hexameric protein [Gryllotalpicola koreensis]|uniref:GTP cyclohydrolase 1 type 2 homolog n=1 Tax=Gryllotalpicola koreensis TaxID=993086 RepID=A0ABP7ZQN5_9MICO
MSGQLTAQQITDRIRADVESRGFSWADATVDTFKVGDPGTVVTGIASSWMATSDVIAAAAAAGCNLLISHEPTFWNHLDNLPAPEAHDEVYAEKMRLIEETGMVIWRFHDHNHFGFTRDPVFDALLDRLGFLPDTEGNSLYATTMVPGIPLSELAVRVEEALGTQNVRVIGDPAMPVHTVGYGGHTLDSCILWRDPADVTIVGEVREWDTFEYYRDAATLGVPRALIVIAHRQLETWGADALAGWLTELIPEVPVHAIDAVEPFRVVAAA